MPIVAATREAIDGAAAALARGEIVAFPTETVYGLGANALDGGGRQDVRRQGAAALQSSDRACAWARGGGRLRRRRRHGRKLLARRSGRAPVSRAEQARRNAPSPISSAPVSTRSRSEHRAIQSPARCLQRPKLPIAAPSANRSGRVSPTTAAHVEAELGDLPAMILDGGPCTLGIESTVVGLDGDVPPCFAWAHFRARRSRGSLGASLLRVKPAASDLARSARHPLCAGNAASPRCGHRPETEKRFSPSAGRAKLRRARSISAGGVISSKPRRISSPRSGRSMKLGAGRSP